MVKGGLVGLIFIFSMSKGICQTTKDTLSISFRDLPLEIVLDSITYKTRYQFSYNSSLLPRGSLFTLTRNQIQIDSLLRILLVGTGLVHEKLDDQIFLKKKPEEKEKTIPVTLLSGWVRESESKEPVQGVNVFLNGTMIGAATDQHGTYEIRDVPEGSYILVFSHVGYRLISYSLSIEENSTKVVNALLDQKLEELDVIELVATPFVEEDDWPKYYRQFTREFLGTSGNAIKCEILNSEVLDFSFDKEDEVLTAEAKEALIIENKALGYKLTYELESFTKSSTSTSFYGKARFENLEPTNKRERKRWRRNRVKSYNGSISHFFKSLIKNNHFGQGYQVFRFNSQEDIDNNNFSVVNPQQMITKSKNDFEWIFSFDGRLLIQYNKEVENAQYLREVNADRFTEGITGLHLLKPAAQRSIIELNNEEVTIDKYGQIKEPFGLKTTGYWAWERIGEMMPAEFNPKTDNL